MFLHVEDTILHEERLEVARGEWLQEKLVHARANSLIAELLAREGSEAANVRRRKGRVRVGLLELCKHPSHSFGRLWTTQPRHAVVDYD